MIFHLQFGINLPSPVVASGIRNDHSLGDSCRSKFFLCSSAFGIAYYEFCNTHVDHVTVSGPFTVLPHIHKSIFVLGRTEICPCSPSCCFTMRCLLLWHLQMSTISFPIPHPLLVGPHPGLRCTWARPQSTYKFLAPPAAFFREEKTSRLNLHWKISQSITHAALSIW